MVLLVVMVLAASPDAGVLFSRPVSISAQRATDDLKARRATWVGEVHARRDGLTLTCQRLDAEYDARGITRLTAQGDVVVHDGEREAHGETAEFDNRTGVLVARGHPWAREGAREVEGEVVTLTTGDDRLVVDRARTRAVEPRAGTVHIEADQLVLLRASSTALWKGHVRAVRGPTTLTAPELVATWDAAGALTRLAARGGVEAVEPRRRAWGQRADYDLLKGVLVVTGKPEARDQTSHLQGTRVTLFPDSEFIEVENATIVIDARQGP